MHGVVLIRINTLFCCCPFCYGTILTEAYTIQQTRKEGEGMRILINTSSSGNDYIFSIDLAKSLQNLGVEIFLAVTGVPLNDEQKTELKQFDYAYANYKQDWMENPGTDLLEAGQWLMKIKTNFKPDLVHLNSMLFGILPWNVPVVTVIHTCMVSRSKAIHNNHLPQKWEMYKQMARASLRASDAVIAPTQSTLSAAEDIYGPFKNSRVIPQGRSAYIFRSSVKKKYIFCNGKLMDEANNLELILNAAPEIDYPIYIADSLGHMRKKSLAENVFLTGPVKGKKLSDWMSSASVYVLPSKYETFGYSFVDAALSKCALIGGNIISLRETWGNSMLYVENKNELVKAVNRLMENMDDLYLLGQKAYETALENYTLIKMARRYYQLYLQMMTVKPEAISRLRKKSTVFRKFDNPQIKSGNL